MKKFYCFLIIFCFSFTLSASDGISISQLPGDDKVIVPEGYTALLDSANTYYSEGNYKKSLEFNINYLLQAFSSKNPNNIHKGYRMLGINARGLNDTILTRESFQKSEKFALNSKNQESIALAYLDLATYYSTNKHLKKAFYYHDKSIELYEKIGNVQGQAKANYIAILSAMQAQNYKRAYIHILKARRLNKIAGNSSLNIGLDYYLGEYYAQKENFDLADKYLQKAIDEAKKDNLTVELEKAYEYYSNSLFKQNRYDEASTARTIFELYKHLNNESTKTSETEALSAQFQVSEYRKDVKAAELENQLQAEIVENKSKLNTFLMIVTACFLVLFIALFMAYRKRKELVKELKIKNKEYLKAKEHSERLSKTKSNFFSTVSHELRTPLYGVIGLSTILLEDESLKKHENDLKSLKFSADYLLALINDVLHINKIDSNNLEDEHTSFNLRDLVKKISSSFEYMRLQNKNRIHIHISEGIPKFILGNSVRLSQVLMNLIGNACKFTEDGDIYIIAETIATNEKNTTIKFHIKDTGIGIPINKQESIFDEFSQADSIDYKYQGTGLGLPIVKKLLAMSNSEIEVESNPGEGALFSFALTFEQTTEIEKKKDLSHMDTTTLNGKNILIVEDNRINQMVTKKILQKSNTICSIAENGEEAVRMVNEFDYDLVLMDINMPKKNGMEATKEIRKFNTDIPILALTAVEVEEMRQQIYESGMNDIIVKPYDIIKFKQTLLKNLSRSEVPKKENHNSRLRAV